MMNFRSSVTIGIAVANASDDILITSAAGRIGAPSPTRSNWVRYAFQRATCVTSLARFASNVWRILSSRQRDVR